MRTKSVCGNRRGVSLVQMAVVLAVVTVVSLGSFFAMGTATSVWLNAAATNAGDPSTLVSRFNH